MTFNIYDRIKQLRLIDDLFFACVFDNNPRDFEFILRIIMARPNLCIKKMVSQNNVANIYGRGVIFDVFATDENEEEFEVEVQRDERNASPKRARYNSSMMISCTLRKARIFRGSHKLMLL